MADKDEIHDTTDYETLKKDELVDVADQKGVDVKSSATKTEIVEALEEADANPAYGVPGPAEGEAGSITAEEQEPYGVPGRPEAP